MPSTPPTPPDARIFTVTRAGCPGIQRYAQTWSGDNTTSWETLRWNLRTGLQMGLSGMVNIGHDIGGFWGPIPDPELLIRWTQTGVVHPRFIMNSWKPEGVYTSPWLHPQALPAIREAIRLRYRLLPYLYSLMHAAADQRGAGAFNRPLCPSRTMRIDLRRQRRADARTLPARGTGRGILAIARVHVAYLPAGARSLVRLSPPARCLRRRAGMSALDAPLDRLPLLVRAGAILPMTDADTGQRHDEPSRCRASLSRHQEPATVANSSWSRMTASSADGHGLCVCSAASTWDAVGPSSFHVDADGHGPGPGRDIRVATAERPRADLSLHVFAGPGAPRRHRLIVLICNRRMTQ